jgi:U3 snoRNA associated
MHPLDQRNNFDGDLIVVSSKRPLDAPQETPSKRRKAVKTPRAREPSAKKSSSLKHQGHRTAEDNTKYCYCGEAEYGNMVVCDNADCKGQRFHWKCAGITEEPEREWWCRDCAKLLQNTIGAGQNGVHDATPTRHKPRAAISEEELQTGSPGAIEDTNGEQPVAILAEGQGQSATVEGVKEIEPEQTGPVNRHIHFDDQDDVSTLAPAPAPATNDRGAASALHPPHESDAFVESDEDEAPEAVSLSTAKQQSKAEAAAATEAIKGQRADEKKKRQQRAERLKEQAKSNERRQTKAIAEDEQIQDTKIHKALGDDLSEADRKDDEEQQAFDGISGDMPAPHQSYDLNNLPTLLPAELLETAAPDRPPTPPTEQRSTSRSKKLDYSNLTTKEKRIFKQLLEKASVEKPPKDKKRGPVHVSVLPKSNPLLPPKVGPSSTVRKEWESGRVSGKIAVAKNVSTYKKWMGKAVFGKMQRRPFGAAKKDFA